MDISLEFALKIGDKTRILKLGVSASAYEVGNWKIDTLRADRITCGSISSGLDSKIRQMKREGRRL